MKKKVLSLVLTAAMMTTMLAGCGSSDNGSTAASTGEAPAAATTEAAAASTEAAPAEEVTLKWAIWDQETTQYWGDIKDAYEASHPGVTIEMVDLGSTDYMTVLATELSGSGSDFDVVTVKDVPGYATLVQKGSILSLDDYISKDGVDLSKYAGVTDQVTVDGSLYELPFRNDFWVLFYNKDLFDAKGVAYPTRYSAVTFTPPRTATSSCLLISSSHCLMEFSRRSLYVLSSCGCHIISLQTYSDTELLHILLKFADAL